MSVSYTHLDVYKRQLVHCQDPAHAFNVVCGRVHDVLIVTSMRHNVFYTVHSAHVVIVTYRRILVLFPRIESLLYQVLLVYPRIVFNIES